MDEKYLEVAEKTTDLLVNDAIARAQVRQVRPKDFDGSCRCGEEVPEGRIAGGYYNCVRCQTLLERRGKTYAEK
jgi:RNA polymerase-binding transcription factor DksA